MYTTSKWFGMAQYPFGKLSNTFELKWIDINISCFYACKMLFRALESLFDQQRVFDLTLLNSLITNVYHFQLV